MTGPESEIQLARERLAGLKASLWAIDHHVEFAQLATNSIDAADLEAHTFDKNGGGKVRIATAGPPARASSGHCSLAVNRSRAS
ncbi:hypothetical protein HG717_36180 (plasmid) [Rhodococcus erythropolis]|uniref:hypothetical protein n=1 Tax=Rhodococcus erythropolis TaxID=1833 RepID=UPI001C9ABB38|nr:hypothetical protein [Rhodococcus erythropolis]MBY6389304.1 hypothetical protein [Rhodococcus erythropolis]